MRKSRILLGLLLAALALDARLVAAAVAPQVSVDPHGLEVTMTPEGQLARIAFRSSVDADCFELGCTSELLGAAGAAVALAAASAALAAAIADGVPGDELAVYIAMEASAALFMASAQVALDECLSRT